MSGALLAVGLDDAGGRLGVVLRQLVARRTSGGPAAIDGEAFFAMLRDGSEQVERLVAAFVQGRAIPIRASVGGPCARQTRRTVHRFELGLSTDDEGAHVVTVAPGSAAERAGVRSGDAIAAITYEPDRSDVPVILVVVREGRNRELRFLPRGPGRSAPALTLVPGCRA